MLLPRWSPSLAALRELDLPRAVGLLRSAQHTLERAGDAAPSDALAGWGFAALARLDRHQMDPDACATVRGLVTASVALRARIADAAAEDEDHARRVAALSVILTIAGGYFRQAPAEEWEGG